MTKPIVWTDSSKALKKPLEEYNAGGKPRYHFNQNHSWPGISCHKERFPDYLSLGPAPPQTTGLQTLSSLPQPPNWQIPAFRPPEEVLSFTTWQTPMEGEHWFILTSSLVLIVSTPAQPRWPSGPCLRWIGRFTEALFLCQGQVFYHPQNAETSAGTFLLLWCSVQLRTIMCNWKNTIKNK